MGDGGITRKIEAEVQNTDMAPRKFLTLAAGSGATDWASKMPMLLSSVRNPAPVIDVTKWTLSIQGDGVNIPITLTYDHLLKMPVKKVIQYIECDSNGSSHYGNVLSSQEQDSRQNAAIYGIYEWVGVQVGDLLNKAGVKDSAVYVTFTGPDRTHSPRPMHVAKAMAGDTILAYMMNGTILSIDRGFPARIVAYGLGGVANVKWVNTITVSITGSPVLDQAISSQLKPSPWCPCGPFTYPPGSGIAPT
ncbi:MAG: molybdopterin-dependent oxidoreductase [Dehalococcoidia bacterium]